MRCGCAPAHRRVPDATRPFAGVPSHGGTSRHARHAWHRLPFLNGQVSPALPILPLRRSALSRQPDEMKGEIAKAHVVLTPSAEPNADGILTLCRGRADANNSSSALASDNRREVRSSPRSPAHRTVSGIPTPSLNVRATSAQAREATAALISGLSPLACTAGAGRASGRWCRERGRGSLAEVGGDQVVDRLAAFAAAPFASVARDDRRA